MELDMDYIKIYFMAMRKLFNGQREYQMVRWECERKYFKLFKIKSF